MKLKYKVGDMVVQHGERYVVQQIISEGGVFGPYVIGHRQPSPSALSWYADEDELSPDLEYINTKLIKEWFGVPDEV